MSFSRQELTSNPAATRVLYRRKFANAVLTRYDRADGSWVIKDFSHAPWPWRATIGRAMARREWSALSRLSGIPGMPQGAFRLDAYAVCYRYVEGQSLPQLAPGTLDGRFFRALERAVWRMHRRGIAHLDLRCRSNVLRTPEGLPAVIDFQAHAHLGLFTPRLRKLLRGVDYSGVYKQWCKRAPDSFGERRLRVLRGFNRWRRLWILEGYHLFSLKRGNWRHYEQNWKAKQNA